MAIVVKRTILGAFATFTSRGIEAEFSLSQVQGLLSFALVELSVLPSCYMPTQTLEA
jgi:hypothetical protein